MCQTRAMRNTLTMLLLCTAGFAQQQPGTLDPAKDPAKIAEKEKEEKAEESTFGVETNIVIAPTTVLDKHGDYVNGLYLRTSSCMTTTSSNTSWRMCTTSRSLWWWRCKKAQT